MNTPPRTRNCCHSVVSLVTLCDCVALGGPNEEWGPSTLRGTLLQFGINFRISLPSVIEVLLLSLPDLPLRTTTLGLLVNSSLRHRIRNNTASQHTERIAEMGTASNSCDVALANRAPRSLRRRGCMLFLLSMAHACYGWRWQISHGMMHRNIAA
jgi:hypothetical protein